MAAKTHRSPSLHTAKDDQQLLKLLQGSPDPDALDEKGDAPLHAYVRRRDKHRLMCLMTFLIHSRCDVDLPNMEGLTALHLAAELNDIPCAKALLSFCADVNCLSPSNHTPVDIAHDNHSYDSEMVRILAAVGGQHGDAVMRSLYTLPSLHLAGDLTGNVAALTQDEDLPTPIAYSEGRDCPLAGMDGREHLHCPPNTCSGTSKVGTWRTGLSKRPTSSELDGSSSDTETEQTDHCARGSEVAKGGVARAARSHTRQVRFATPDASVELYALTLREVTSVRQSLLSAESPESSISSWIHVDSPLTGSLASLGSVSEREEGRGGRREGAQDLTDSDIHVASPLSPRTIEGKSRLLADYLRESLYPRLEAGTREALERGVEATLPGDEGYAAWLQYREIKRAMKQQKKSVGSLNADASIYTRSLGGPGRSLMVPLPFKAKTGERILCLDGGGIKGLVQIEILSQIEQGTGRRITELFDWIVATSTGGILALAMVYADCSLLDLRRLYFEMKDEVFSNPRFGLACDSTALEKLLKKKLGPETMMSDKTSPKVLITAVDKSNTDLNLRFFNNCFDNAFAQHPVWKVARYTSAAPIYFTECDNYVDGGVLANNPTASGLTEIQDYLDTHARGTKIACVVSVGCGVFPPKDLANTDVFSAGKGKDKFKLANYIVHRPKNLFTLLGTAMTKSEDVARNSRSRCEKQGIPYYRFSPIFDEIVDTIETDGEKLCDVIVKAKMSLQAYDAQMDELIQHFYYTAAYENGSH